MFCTNCGAELPDGSKFCTNCGAVVTHDGSGPADAHVGEKDEVDEGGDLPKRGESDTAEVPGGNGEATEDVTRTLEKPVAPESADKQEAEAETEAEADAEEAERTLWGDEGAAATEDETVVRPPVAGAAPAAGPASNGQDVVYCTNCGAPMPADAKFCENCGAPTGQAGAPAATNADAGTASQESRPPKKSKAPLVAAIVAVVLLVCAGTAFGLHYTGALGENDPLAFLPQSPAVKKAAEEKAAAAKKKSDSDKSDSTKTVKVTAKSDDSDSDASQSDGTDDESTSTTDESDSSDTSDQYESGDEAYWHSQKVSYTVVRQAMTWSEAEQYCEDHGGKLACITTQTEWDNVKSLLDQAGGSVFWIGGGRNDAGNFEWVDGSDFDFTAWAAGEPNNDGGSEPCLAILKANGNYAWYDVPDDVSSYYKSDKMGFVMETFD